MQAEPPNPPPRAFTQGVGTVYQVVGVLLFLTMMFICCGSGLIGKEAAIRPDLLAAGWTFKLGNTEIFYSAQRALSLSVTLGVFFGLGLAGIGLGLQAQRPRAPIMGIALTLIATAFWLTHTVFAVQKMHSILLVLLALVLTGIYGSLLGLTLVSWQEMRRNPPPERQEILPADYKVPYSHMNQDPPEIRLARELEQRRGRLAVQQKELELLEEKLRRKIDQKREE